MEIVSQFNENAIDYFKFRPRYPIELFEWIKTITPHHKLALDCGTGNGQAAIGLVRFFDKIIATDLSPNQLKQAIVHPKIKYFQMPAEQIDLADHSIDLIVSASAAHWFDLDLFYQECERLLTPAGRIVVWTYTWPQSANLALNKILKQIKCVLNSEWSQKSLLHLNQYKDLSFPFKTLKSPNFQFKKSWTLDQLLDFFSTWACIKNYLNTKNKIFLDAIKLDLQKVWSVNRPQEIFIFPLYLKAGKL